MASRDQVGNNGGNDQILRRNPAPSRRKRRWPWVLGGLLLVLIAGAAIAAWRAEAWINAAVARELPGISKTLGRPVRVGAIDVSLLTGAAVEVRDLEIGPDPAAPAGTLPPALKLPRARVGVGLWSTLLSGGKRINVREIIVEGLAVHATKHADGKLDWQHMAERWQAANPSEESPPDERVRHARLEKLRVHISRLGFSDLVQPAQRAEINDILLAGDGIGLDRAFVLTMGASLLGATKNFDLRAAFGPSPDRGADIVAPPLTKLNLRLARTELAPLAPFMAAQVATAGTPDFERGAIELTLEATPGAALEGGSGPSHAKVNLLVAGAQLIGGEAFDARLVLDARADANAGDIEITAFTASLAEMMIEARGSLHALRSAPRFDGFMLTSKGLDFDRLQRLTPSRTPSLKMGGPFSISAEAGGDGGAQQFEAQLDLTSASIAVGESFAKPAGIALVIEAKGSAEGDTVKLDPFSLTIADWRAFVRGTISQLSQKEPKLDLKIETDAPGVAGLARLLPPVAKSLPADRPVSGRIAIDGTIVGTASDVTANIKAAFSDMAISAPDTRINGQGSMLLDARKKAQDLDATLAIDLGGLEAVYQDVIRKSAGSALTANASATRRGGKTTAKGDVKLPGLRASGEATITGDGEAQPQSFVASFNISELSVGPLVAFMPSAFEGQPMPDARLTAQAIARGLIERPESLHVEVKKLELTSGKSDLSATAAFDDLSRPRVQVDIRSSYLDIDELLPTKRTGGGKDPGGTKQPSPKPDPDSMLVKASGQVKLAIERGRVSQIDFQGLRADLGLRGGRLIARTLEVGAFGGRFSGSGSELPLAEEDGAVTLKGKVSGLDIDAVIARFGDGRDLLRGKLSADIDLTSRGTQAVDVQQTLTGVVGGKLDDAEFVPADLLASIMGPIGKAVSVPGFAALLGGANKQIEKLNGRQLRDVEGEARIAKGAMEFSKPLTANTPSGPLSLSGRILLEGRTDLTGQLNMSAATATAVTGGKVKMTESVPVEIAVTGPLRRPSIRPTNLDTVAKAFATAYLTSEAGRALQSQVTKGAEALLKKTGLGSQLPGGVAGVAEDPGAAAQKAQDEARGKADAALREQQTRAQTEADAAQKRAEEEARARAEQAKQNAKGKLRGILGR